MKQLCENCDFYLQGYCRRYPPKNAYNKDLETKYPYGYPLVGKDMWCGEWQPDKNHIFNVTTHEVQVLPK